MKYKIIIKSGIFSAIIVIIFSCTQINRVEVPENVQAVLEKSGDNRKELEKVINAYQHPEDSSKLKAAFFLISNMEEKCFIRFTVVDSTEKDIGFNVLNYPDYNKMISGWDSLEDMYGKLHQKKEEIVIDYNTITSSFLISNIDLAFKAWTENPWARHIKFDQFCEYILPYRSTNEPLENWRTYFYDKYSWVKDSVKQKNDPIEASILINNDIKSWFTFDPRFYRQSTDQGLSNMLKNKIGRCEDMTNLTIFAMRSMGIPVMSDFTPYWAKTGNNHAWNAIIDTTGKVIIFMGAESNPGVYKLNRAISKVYRKTFAKQQNSLAAIKDEWEKAPRYINRNNIVDVTRDYVPVADVNLTLEKEIPDSANFAYICVFNTGEWKVIQWSKIADGRTVTFTDMGKDIAYLPAYYVNEKIIPAGKQFILTKEGAIVFNESDTKNLTTIKLISTTRKITKNATDNIEQTFFKDGENYELFYWNYGWISLGKQKAAGKPLVFKNVPSNALYWLIAEKTRKEERIFTINENGEQVWW